MKRVAVILMFFIPAFFTATHAQIFELTDTAANQYCNGETNNGMGQSPMSGKYISVYTFNRLLRKDFSLMTTNEEGLPAVGNYASIKFSDNNSKIALNGSFFNLFIKGKTKPIRNILSVGVKGGISEGVASIFSNTSFNNNAGVNSRFSMINWKKSVYEYSQFNCATMDLNRGLLQQQYINETRKTVLKENGINAELDRLRGVRHVVDSTLAVVTNTIATNTASPDPATQATLPGLQLQKDQLETRSLRLFDSIVVQRNALQELNADPVQKQKQLDTMYLNKLYVYEAKFVTWKQIRIRWFDIFADVSGNSYKLLNRKDSIHKQITTKKFQQFKLGITWNAFRTLPDNAIFRWGYVSRMTLQFSNGNNLKETSKRDVETIITIDTPRFTRRVIEKLNAYEQSFQQDFKFALIYQLSTFLNEHKNKGLSLYVNSQWGYEDFWKPFQTIEAKPDLSLGTGYFLTILDKEKEDAVINFELFLRFHDVFNTGDSDKSFLSRNEIGIKVGLPFRSIFLNQNKML